MPEKDTAFAALLQRARNGDQDAIRELVKTFDPTILKVARGKLKSQLHSLFDPTDVSQEVWQAFFAREIQRQTFDRPEQLQHYLARMARNWVAGTNRRYLECRRYGGGRVQSQERGDERVKEPVAKVSWPAECMREEALWEDLLSRCHSIKEQFMLVFLRFGFSFQFVARRHEVSVKTVQRFLGRLADDVGVRAVRRGKWTF